MYLKWLIVVIAVIGLVLLAFVYIRNIILAKRLDKKEQKLKTEIEDAKKKNVAYANFLKKEKNIYLGDKEYNKGVLQSFDIAIDKTLNNPSVEPGKEVEWFEEMLEEVSSYPDKSDYSKGVIDGLKQSKKYYIQLMIT